MGDTKESQASLADQIEKALEDSAPDLGPVTVRLQIEGPGGLYEGQTVDITPAGALIQIADGKLVSAAESRNLANFNRKVSEEFRSGMRIRLAGNGVFHEAGLVRVVEPEEKRDPLLIACNFYTPLSPEECRRLGVDSESRADALKEILESEVPPDQEPCPDDLETEDLPAVLEGDKGPPSGRERRKAPRVDRVLYADVEGDFDAYKALVMNVSFNGALLTLTDPSFVPPTERDKLVLFTRRLGVQFGNGLVLRLLEPDVSVQSDVVRVSERQSGTSHIVVVGCKFRRNLTPQECQRLGIDPPPADSAEEAVLAVANPYFRQTRIRDLMVQAMKAGATDLHLKVHSLPRMRQGGILFNMDKELVRPEEAHAMALELMSHEQAARFERDGDVELAYTIDDVGRFRVNVLRQRGLTGLAIRCIPGDVPTLDSLKLSPFVKTLADRPRGLVLVTGPTGSGKSTTLAAIINHVNRTRPCHIITMEDPIEYLHNDIKAHVTQREIGRDATDFSIALKRALRQDPDVIMVGEMRDLETISLALTAAETGHLVFATLHTTSAALTPDRIVDVFPPSQQTQIRLQLADSLQGIMAQTLLPRKDTNGMVLVQEILVATDAVRALIRERKTPQIVNMMQTGAKEGMQTLESGLNELVQKGVIPYEAAASKANFPRQIRRRGQ